MRELYEEGGSTRQPRGQTCWPSQMARASLKLGTLLNCASSNKVRPSNCTPPNQAVPVNRALLKEAVPPNKAASRSCARSSHLPSPDEGVNLRLLPGIKASPPNQTLLNCTSSKSAPSPVNWARNQASPP